MKLGILALCFLPAVWGGTIKTPPTNSICQTLANHGLTNLDRHGCGDVQPMGPIPVGAKEEACDALYHGGLTNLSSYGCVEGFRAYRLDHDDKNGTQPKGYNGGSPLMSRRGKEDDKRPPKLREPAECSSSRLCSILQKGLVAVNLFGCRGGNDDFSLDDDDDNTTTCSKKACRLLQSSLINMNAFGCS
ncbi:hypothetical protein V8E36_001721 [Tilletia maclaganii]